MKDIDKNISYPRWFAAGIWGAIAALFPWAGAIWGLGALGVELDEGATIPFVALVMGSFGGASAYHSLIAGPIIRSSRTDRDAKKGPP